MKNLPQIIDKIDNELLASELIKQGMTEDVIATKLKECLEATSIKLNKNGDVHEGIDYVSRLKAIELWAKIMGVTGRGTGSLHLHQHLSGVELDELNRKATATQRNTTEG